MASSAPIEAKVKTSTAAALVSTLVLALLAQYVFKGETPTFVVAFVESTALSVVTAAVTFTVGWLTKHTGRVIDISENRDM